MESSSLLGSINGFIFIFGLLIFIVLLILLFGELLLILLILLLVLLLVLLLLVLSLIVLFLYICSVNFGDFKSYIFPIFLLLSTNSFESVENLLALNVVKLPFFK